MAHFDRDEDTICALTTGAGQSGIAVIRVSGPESLSIVKQLCSFLPEEPTSHRVYHGLLKEHGQSVDEVLVSYFAKGRSYTGDETCEVSCHGSPVVASQILSNLIQLGCRPADRGEFTYRSFMNGRIDLVQAESVLSLIESSSKKAARLAVDQLQGQLSVHFREIEDSILWILSRIEAGIDFSTEDDQKMKWRKEISTDFVELSVTKNLGLEILESQIGTSFKLDASDETTVVIHSRHEKNLRSANDALVRAQKALAEGMSHEFVCVDLREALLSIGNILGKGLDEDVISRIFKDFCIGK